MVRRRLGVVGGMVLAVTIGVSQAGAQAPAGDLPALVAGLDFSERGVKKWLERLGATAAGPATERLLLVSLTGEDVLTRQGNASSVHLDAEIDERFLLRPVRAVVLVHNHPASVGLSGPDLGQLAKPGVAAVIAVAHDGSVFAAAPGGRMHPDFLESRQHAWAKAEVARRLREEGPSGSVPVAVSDGHLNHLVSLTMAKTSVIDYWHTLRGSGRESFDKARIVFNRVIVGAGARLKDIDGY